MIPRSLAALLAARWLGLGSVVWSPRGGFDLSGRAPRSRLGDTGYARARGLHRPGPGRRYSGPQLPRRESGPRRLTRLPRRTRSAGEGRQARGRRSSYSEGTSVGVLMFLVLSVYATEGAVAAAMTTSLAPVGSSHSRVGVRATRRTTASQLGQRSTVPMP